METLAEKIKRRAHEMREADKQGKFKQFPLSKVANQVYEGRTASGKKVIFEIITGITEQGLYGAGTLKCEGKTIFTKGYPSKAMAWMSKN